MTLREAIRKAQHETRARMDLLLENHNGSIDKYVRARLHAEICGYRDATRALDAALAEVADDTLHNAEGPMPDAR